MRKFQKSDTHTSTGPITKPAQAAANMARREVETAVTERAAPQLKRKPDVKSR